MQRREKLSVVESSGSTSEAVTCQCSPGKGDVSGGDSERGKRWTNSLEGPAVIVGRAAKSLSIVEAGRLASTTRLRQRGRSKGEGERLTTEIAETRSG